MNLTRPTNSKWVLIIGESTAAGVGASCPDTTFAAKIFSESDRTWNVLNLGKNGLKAAGLNRLLNHAKPDIPIVFDQVIILIGANDCFKFTPPSKFRNEIEEFLKIVGRNTNCHQIIIPEIPPVNHFPAIPSILRFFLGLHRHILNNEINRLNKKKHKLYFHRWKSGFSSNFFASDGIHPSDIGYEKMAKEIFEEIKGGLK
ncbi:SGNH/GDSL hydrolase family protein [Mongoliitalea lutea]|uniref:SGNH hydrolase-type esterase domain-containing protein n=1 Tax=Mongoliitalea lutea TaxID=849756 RepID=A0A8J3D1H3_9BACT|nr:SGNH/GDSL hydrolase family protein [Mongoliitalea lutea]GHB49546.1 hypothetical protein GCM10008106_32840 [Mongoliitalea lutea]